MAWKNETTQVKVLKLGCGHSFNFSSLSLETMDFIFSFKPSGGSVTTFNDFYKIPKGNSLVGYVVSHSLKSLWGFSICSKLFSSTLSHLLSK